MESEVTPLATPPETYGEPEELPEISVAMADPGAAGQAAMHGVASRGADPRGENLEEIEPAIQGGIHGAEPDEERPGQPRDGGIAGPAGFGVSWRSLSAWRRIVVVLLPLVLAVGAAGGVWFVTRPRPASPLVRRFVDMTQPLIVGPAAGFAASGLIERGEPVEVLDRGETYALVRDASGRVGYVRAHEVSAVAPAIGPETPFTRCRRRPLEADPTACEQRGREQLGACRRGCAAAEAPPTCVDQCAARLVDCQRSCAAPPTDRPEGATADAIGAAAAPPASTASPGDLAPAAVADGEPAPGVSATALESEGKAKSGKAKRSRKAKASAKKKAKRRR